MPDEAGRSPGSRRRSRPGRLDEAAAALDRREPVWAASAGAGDRRRRRRRAGPATWCSTRSGSPRRAAVLLPDAAADLRPEGPLRAAQFTEEGVWAVVDLPAFGYAWVPRETDPAAPAAPLGTRSRSATGCFATSRSSVEIDPATGGIRGLQGRRREAPRGSASSSSIDGPDRARRQAALASRMRVRVVRGRVRRAGPGAGGHDAGRSSTPRRPAARLVPAAIPALDRPADPRDRDHPGGPRPALARRRIAGADPWASYLACRWAWPDPSSMLRRTCLLAPELTEADRPETPDAIDISTRRAADRPALRRPGPPPQARHADARHAPGRRPRVGPDVHARRRRSTSSTRSTPRSTCRPGLRRPDRGRAARDRARPAGSCRSTTRPSP